MILYTATLSIQKYKPNKTIWKDKGDPKLKKKEKKKKRNEKEAILEHQGPFVLNEKKARSWSCF